MAQIEPVREAMQDDGMEAGIREDDLQVALRRGVLIVERLDVFANSVQHGHAPIGTSRPVHPADGYVWTGKRPPQRGPLPSPTEAAAPRIAECGQGRIAQLEKRRERRALRGEHQDAAAGVAGFSAVFLISVVVFAVASLTASFALVVSAGFSLLSSDADAVAASGALLSLSLLRTVRTGRAAVRLVPAGTLEDDRRGLHDPANRYTHLRVLGQGIIVETLADLEAAPIGPFIDIDWHPVRTAMEGAGM